MFQAEGISVSYGQSRVISGMTFAAADKEILAVVGRNGMGKTTLFKALIGILPTGAGTIVMDGVPLEGQEPCQRVATGLAYVPQGRMIFPHLTVEENIVTGLRSRGETVPEEIYSFFPVLKDMRRRRGGNLSGGQQQQLAIARALASHPRVLLLDEPTEGIQPSLIKELAQMLKVIRDKTGLTIIVSEQVLSFVLDMADRLLVIDRGRIIQETLRHDANVEALTRSLSI
jgi:urea transport system ATP-binding protein